MLKPVHMNKGSTDLKMKGVALVLEENGKFLLNFSLASRDPGGQCGG